MISENFSVERLDFCKYELVPKAKLGRFNGSTRREGALLRIQFKDGIQGFADCHPWTELSDPPLSDQLKLLKAGNPTYLGRHSLSFARRDAEARAQGRSWWSKGEVISQNHAFLGSTDELNEEILEQKAKLGFKILKIKMGLNVREEARKLSSLISSFDPFKFKLRLDFNSGLSPLEFEEFLENLGVVREWIDFIEDPMPYDARSWTQAQRRWGVRLALDRISVERKVELAPHSFSVLILKPAVQDLSEGLSLAGEYRCSLVITSYLDHPVGQLCAASVASAMKMHSGVHLEPCGLLSHLAYEPNPFSELLQTEGPTLKGSEGTGFGMDQLLEETKWERL